ncbi:NAD-dependent epimerase/dehydratase family protein [Paenibacillus sp. FA6]|uniref:NAD-dependent epimerase/dehydratase family protein n=1 Tax=Paenibacillus sp. FA6 TaxID=3413029 RepID=UPI003F65D515
MKILIIGGTGFIGPYVVEELIELGHEVAIFNRGTNNRLISQDTVTFITGDRQFLNSYRQEFIEFAPEVVIHMGAYTKQDAEMAMSTFEGIAERIIVLSSMDVYYAYGILIGLEEGFTPTPLKENSLLRSKLHPYGGDYEKILVEEIIMNSPRLAGTILRLPMVYGPGDPSHRLYKYVKRVSDNRNAIILDELFANWRASHGYVENIAHAITVAASDKRAKYGIYNIGEENTQTEYEWLNNITRIMNWHGKILSIPRERLPRELIYETLNLHQDWALDTSKIRQELDFNEHITLEEGLERTITWELNNPPEELHPKDFPKFDYEIEDEFLKNSL